jgi:hypothetical protein
LQGTGLEPVLIQNSPHRTVALAEARPSSQLFRTDLSVQASSGFPCRCVAALPENRNYDRSCAACQMRQISTISPSTRYTAT